MAQENSFFFRVLPHILDKARVRSLKRCSGILTTKKKLSLLFFIFIACQETIHYSQEELRGRGYISLERFNEISASRFFFVFFLFSIFFFYHCRPSGFHFRAVAVFLFSLRHRTGNYWKDLHTVKHWLIPDVTIQHAQRYLGPHAMMK